MFIKIPMPRPPNIPDSFNLQSIFLISDIIEI